MAMDFRLNKLVRRGTALALKSLFAIAGASILTHSGAQSGETPQQPTAASSAASMDTAPFIVIVPAAPASAASEPTAAEPKPPSDAEKIKTAVCKETFKSPAANHVAVIINVTTGEMISNNCRNVDKPWTPASLTKLQAIYTALDIMKESNGQINGDTRITISKNVANEVSIMNIGYKAGEKVAVKDLITAMIVHSANDAALALAEGLAGSEKAFVAKMNVTAEKLNMTGSEFFNSSGWPIKGQVSNARDIILLTNALQKDFPEYNDLLVATRAQHKKRFFGPHDNIRNDRTVQQQMDEGLDLGLLKTGYVDKSRFNIAMGATLPGQAASTAIIAKQELRGVIMGAESDQARVLIAKDLFSQAIKTWAPEMPNLLEPKKKIWIKPSRSSGRPRSAAESAPTAG